MDKNVLKERVNQILADEFELESDELVPEARLYEDLGLDSLDAVDMVVGFEKAFSISIGKNTELVSIKTLGELYTFIDKTVSSQAG